MSTNPPVPDDSSVPDEALDRVRAADPAATAEPDQARLRAAVADRAAAAAAAEGDVHGSGVVTELAPARVARTGRRRGAWIQVAAAVVGLSVIGGGSWALGRLGQAPVAAPISLGSGSSEGGAVTAVAPRAASGAAAADSAAGMGTSKLIAPWYGGRTVFTGSGLSTDGATATAWGFDPASVYSADAAAHLASVLGVSGTPSQTWGAWVVGVQDGTGPTVQLSPDGLASFSYYDPSRDPWACVKSAPDVPSGSTEPGAAGSATGDTAPAPAAEPAIGAATPGSEPTLGTAVPEQLDPSYGCATTSAAPAPTGDAAIAQARELMGSLGVDAGGYRFEVQADQGQPTATYVSAGQLLDGQLTGVQWSFTLLADGVQSLYGSLAPVVDLGAYALISPADAVARLGDPRFGAGYGGVMPLATDTASGASSSDDRSSSVATAAPEPTVPTTPTAGGSIPWPVQTVTLTTSRLGLGMTTLDTGAVLLLPSYELGNAEGSTWSVIAVTDDRLDFSAGR
ncbi:hypothetical protein DDP54_09950 [Cellulomonas sp. WB94]|uniref:hypothetical protein n=1 Tax=Cellulomonas sp. WB94 TaxID=2173174 RepID=UPI000D585067|nr:hypothetical protein [Cellulomonas sp. WB94]PVU83260.1 hypothetical protein DDP54_09950 [Cellulomonas sp. WB94]